VLIEEWRIDYNMNRPHSAHGWLSPTEFPTAWTNRHEPHSHKRWTNYRDPLRLYFRASTSTEMSQTAMKSQRHYCNKAVDFASGTTQSISARRCGLGGAPLRRGERGGVWLGG
jgi:hypothetical protein